MKLLCVQLSSTTRCNKVNSYRGVKGISDCWQIYIVSWYTLSHSPTLVSHVLSTTVCVQQIKPVR